MEKEFNDMRDVFKVLPTTQEEKEYIIVIGKHLATTEKFPSHDRSSRRENQRCRLEPNCGNDLCLQRGGRIREKIKTLRKKSYKRSY